MLSVLGATKVLDYFPFYFCRLHHMGNVSKSWSVYLCLSSVE